MGDDFKISAAELRRDGRDPSESGGGGLLVEIVPIIGGADAKTSAADGNQPPARTDADMRLRPVGADG